MKLAIAAKPNAGVTIDAIAAVRGAVEIAPAAAQSALSRGGVLLEGEPIEDDALPGKFRALLAALRAYELDFAVYELADGADASQATEDDSIPADALERIISRGEQVGAQEIRRSREGR